MSESNSPKENVKQTTSFRKEVISSALGMALFLVTYCWIGSIIPPMTVSQLIEYCGYNVEEVAFLSSCISVSSIVAITLYHIWNGIPENKIFRCILTLIFSISLFLAIMPLTLIDQQHPVPTQFWTIVYSSIALLLSGVNVRLR